MRWVLPICADLRTLMHLLRHMPCMEGQALKLCSLYDMRGSRNRSVTPNCVTGLVQQMFSPCWLCWKGPGSIQEG